MEKEYHYPAPCRLGTVEEVRVGGVEGKDSVYRIVSKPDFQGLTAIFAGDIVLESGEKVEAVVPDTSFNLVSGWRMLTVGGPYIILNAEKIPFVPECGSGSLFVTDRRIVFLRRPYLRDLQKQFSDGVPASVLKWLAPIARTNSLEYCEIRFEDIARFKEYRNGGTVYIDLGSDKFRLSLDKDSWQIVGPLLMRRHIMSDSADD